MATAVSLILISVLVAIFALSGMQRRKQTEGIDCFNQQATGRITGCSDSAGLNHRINVILVANQLRGYMLSIKILFILFRKPRDNLNFITVIWMSIRIQIQSNLRIAASEIIDPADGIHLLRIDTQVKCWFGECDTRHGTTARKGNCQRIFIRIIAHNLQRFIEIPVSIGIKMQRHFPCFHTTGQNGTGQSYIAIAGRTNTRDTIYTAHINL